MKALYNQWWFNLNRTTRVVCESGIIFKKKDLLLQAQKLPDKGEYDISDDIFDFFWFSLAELIVCSNALIIAQGLPEH